MVCGKILSLQYGVNTKRPHFSDPQGSKVPCDRKAATIKSHMQCKQRYWDISAMRDAILSSGGVPALNVVLCECVEVPSSTIDA